MAGDWTGDPDSTAIPHPNFHRELSGFQKPKTRLMGHADDTRSIKLDPRRANVYDNRASQAAKLD